MIQSSCHLPLILSFPINIPKFTFTQKFVKSVKQPCNMSLKIETIRRNLVLKELEIKETPEGKQIVVSIKFVKKDGELVFMPRAVATGLKMNMKGNRMRGVVPVDSQGNACGHVTPVSIDSLIEYNGIKIKM